MLPDLRRPPSRQEVLVEPGQSGQQRRCPLPLVLRDRADRKPALGIFDRRGEQLFEAQPAEALMQSRPSGHGPRHRHGVPPAHRARRRVGSVAPMEVLGRPGRRCGAAAVQAMQAGALPDSCQRLPPPPALPGFERAFVPPEHGLDAAVAPVAHPAVDAALERLQAQGIAKADALYASVNPEADRSCRRLASSRVQRCDHESLVPPLDCRPAPVVDRPMSLVLSLPPRVARWGLNMWPPLAAAGSWCTYGGAEPRRRTSHETSSGETPPPPLVPTSSTSAGGARGGPPKPLVPDPAGSMASLMSPWPYPRVLAHRGGGAFAPEN